MSSKQWNRIKYENVPSRANLIYNNAFLRNDEERRRDYLNALEKGEVKINSSVLFPHDIVHKYGASHYGLNPKDAALEAMWKNLPDIVNGNGMRTHADDDAIVGAWAFMIGERGVLTGVNMEFTFRGVVNAMTGKVISVFPSGSDEIVAIVPFGQNVAQSPPTVNFVPPPTFPEARQMLLTTGLQGMTSGEVFAYYYCPETFTIWITNTGEYMDALLNHVNIRCADTGEVLTIPMILTHDGVPQLAFLVETTDTGSPRLLAIDSISHPHVVTAIGLSPRTPLPLAVNPPPPHRVSENEALTAHAYSTTPTPPMTPELLEAVTVPGIINQRLCLSRKANLTCTTPNTANIPNTATIKKLNIVCAPYIFEIPSLAMQYINFIAPFCA